jgi:hypothetical protein
MRQRAGIGPTGTASSLAVVLLAFVPVCALLPAGPYGPFPPFVLPFDLRIPWLTATLIVLARGRFHVRWLRPTARPLQIALLAWSAISWLSMAWTTEPSRTAEQAIAILVFLASVGLLFTGCAEAEAKRSLAMAGLIVVGASLVLGLVVPSYFEVQERIRGLFFNANGAGLFCVLMLHCRNWLGRRASWALLVLAGALIVLSGSRASMVGAAVLLSSEQLLSPRRWGRPIAVVSLLLVCAAIISGQIRPDAFGRTENTRADPWNLGVERSFAHLPLGLGGGAAQEEYGNTLLLMTVNLGIPGTALVLVFYGSLLTMGLRHRQMLPLALSVVVHSQFEGWILTGGSPFFLVLVLCFSTAEPTAPRIGERRRSLEPPPNPVIERHEHSLPAMVRRGRGPHGLPGLDARLC